MFRSVVFFALLISVQSAIAAVTTDDLKDIYTLAQAGKYQEALVQHKHFFYESRKEPSLAGVRLSFALAHWVKISEKYPPAKTALLEIRVSLKHSLLSGKENFDSFQELYAINRELDESEQTIEIFSYLDKEQSKLAKIVFHIVEKLLIQQEQFVLANKYQEDPFIELENLKQMRDTFINFAKSDGIIDEKEEWSFNYLYIDGTKQLLNTLMALKQTEIAKEIQTQSQAYFAHEEIASIDIK